MNRPYIFCHMMTALDGKITGDYAEAGGNGTVAEESPCTLGNKGRGKGLFESEVGFTPKSIKVTEGFSVRLRYTVNR